MPAFSVWSASRLRRFAYYSSVIGGLTMLLWYTNGLYMGPAHGDVEAQVHVSNTPLVLESLPGELKSPGLHLTNDPMVGSEELSDLDLKTSHATADIPPILHPEETTSENRTIGLAETSMLDAVERLFETFQTNQQAFPTPTEHNRKTLIELVQCIYSNHCTRKPRLVIFLSTQFHNAFFPGTENWESSILRAFDSLGVFSVYVPHGIQAAQSMHALFALQVKAVISDEDDLKQCFQDTRGCLRSPQNLKGIPAWKMFSWGYLPPNQPPSPLGFAWILSQENRPQGETYLGYSIERVCRDASYVDHAQRLDRTFILANLEAWFIKHHNVWPPKYFEDAGPATGTQFVAALDPVIARVASWPQLAKYHIVPSNLVELGPHSDRDFLQEMAKSRLLLGLFDPREMPVVFSALCLGVPFLNPIRNWDSNNSSDRSKWETQVMALNDLNPPYVYNVFANDYEGFEKAIADAMTHPPPSYTPEHMMEAAVEKRVAAILNRDWKMEAQAVIERKKAAGEQLELLL